MRGHHVAGMRLKAAAGGKRYFIGGDIEGSSAYSPSDARVDLSDSAAREMKLRRLRQPIQNVYVTRVEKV